MNSLRILAASALVSIAAFGTALADDRGGATSFPTNQGHGYVACQTAQGSTATVNGICHYGQPQHWQPAATPSTR
ncbi:MAG TPA: hypothetical protein VL574_00245 [Stellaceae bacterium]|jgi:hypothetical protein|nr:hypothetical protein [Stellaceae bacterium]